MELRHLRYFVAVAEEQNVTRAAARLHVSQPPLSRQIRDLEDELGVALFERSAKSLRLTEAGRVFLDEARAVLRRAEEATQTVKAVAGGTRGELHVGYSPSLTVELLPRVLREFQERNPGIRVVLHDASTEEMLDALRGGRLQLALTINPPSRAVRGLVAEALHRYSVCVAANPEHPLARGRTVSLRELAAERLIAYARKDYPEYHEQLAELFRSLDRVPQIAEEHDSATSLIAAVEAGRGVAIVSESLACLAGPRLKLRPVAPAPPPMVVALICRSGTRSVAAEKFAAAVKAASKTLRAPR